MQAPGIRLRESSSFAIGRRERSRGLSIPGEFGVRSADVDWDHGVRQYRAIGVQTRKPCDRDCESGDRVRNPCVGAERRSNDIAIPHGAVSSEQHTLAFERRPP
jgi:hypothetical protein